MNEAHRRYVQASDAWREYADINRQAWARLAQIQLELATVGLELAARRLHVLSGAKTPADWWAAESDLWAEYTARASDSFLQTMEVVWQRREQVMACAERHATLPESTPGRGQSAA